MRFPAGLNGDLAQVFGKLRGYTAHRGGIESFAVVSIEEYPKVASQRRMRLFEHRIEHRREVAGRGIDDLQHLGGRGLLLQRLARLGDEPRVLHRDDRLRREILQQRDLLVGERPDLLAIDCDHAEQVTVLAQRHGKSTVRAPPRFDHGAADWDRLPDSSGFLPHRRCARALATDHAADRTSPAGLVGSLQGIRQSGRDAALSGEAWKCSPS